MWLHKVKKKGSKTTVVFVGNGKSPQLKKLSDQRSCPRERETSFCAGIHRSREKWLTIWVISCTSDFCREYMQSPFLSMQRPSEPGRESRISVWNEEMEVVKDHCQVTGNQGGVRCWYWRKGTKQIQHVQNWLEKSISVVFWRFFFFEQNDLGCKHFFYLQETAEDHISKIYHRSHALEEEMIILTRRGKKAGLMSEAGEAHISKISSTAVSECEGFRGKGTYLKNISCRTFAKNGRCPHLWKCIVLCWKWKGRSRKKWGEWYNTLPSVNDKYCFCFIIWYCHCFFILPPSPFTQQASTGCTKKSKMGRVRDRVNFCWKRIMTTAQKNCPTKGPVLGSVKHAFEQEYTKVVNNMSRVTRSCKEEVGFLLVRRTPRLREGVGEGETFGGNRSGPHLACKERAKGGGEEEPWL